ncbi:unnamed protein product [Protopolystoma xenopodis]|uniref:Uncharacterized protein n=1 Tax=Protopolystoma xenopodis TaxID=117903 RepID=A0A3S5BBA7_9PLAT|nr:unnamed protein product [Protopolystoma xenopodis]
MKGVEEGNEATEKKALENGAEKLGLEMGWKPMPRIKGATEARITGGQRTRVNLRPKMDLSSPMPTNSRRFDHAPRLVLTATNQ